SSSVEAPTPRCHCGVRSPIRTAWKCDYPGRRFYGCSGLLETNEGIRSENMKLKKTRQELLDEMRHLQQSVHDTTAELEGAVAASMAMEDNMLASVATTRRRGVVIMVLISVIVLLFFFPTKVAS
ncbi:hypothetical protein HN51_002437, partial [Arachis hypogaea]